MRKSPDGWQTWKRVAQNGFRLKKPWPESATGFRRPSRDMKVSFSKEALIDLEEATGWYLGEQAF